MTHLTILTGSSRGMGAAMALQLLRARHDLVGIARQTSAALEDAALASGASLLQWRCDLAEPAGAAQQLAAWLATQDGGRYASVTLINNAGAVAEPAPLADSAIADTVRVLRVGLEAAMLLTGVFLHGTRGWQGPRKVLNISSGLGRRPMASSASYCAAKAGLDLFTRSVALEEADQPNGARLVSLAPGVIDTDMQVQLRTADAASFPDRERFVQLHAQGQLTSPAEAAARVLAWLERPDFGANPLADVRD